MKFLIKLSLPTLILFISAVFFLKASIFIDPDFGWHFKMGELILKQGIPETDPFSYTMPSYPFIDHEWLTNITYYYLHQLVGMPGMALLLTAIGTLTILFFIKSQNQSRFFLAPLFLALAILLPFWGVRPQVETWFLSAVLLAVVSNDDLWAKWKWLLPLYFLIWANLHGGFPVGLLIILIALICQDFTRRKILISNIILFFSCLGATLINPYGFSLWKEVWQQVSDINLRWTITEWVPLILTPNWAFLSFSPLFVLSAFLVFYFRSKLAPYQISLYALLLLASLSSQRHLPLWVLIALPLTTQTLEMFYKKIKSIKYAQKRFKIAYRILLIASFSFFVWQTMTALQPQALTEENYYPQQAVNLLKQYPNGIRIFNDYGWGGYLIWKLPNQKVFIDGRMPSWKWQPPSEKESPAAFADYNKIVNNAEGLKILDKYQVQFILWPTKDKKEDNLATKFHRWERKIFAKLFSIPNSTPFEERLENARWQKIYQDPVATLYQRPKN